MKNKCYTPSILGGCLQADLLFLSCLTEWEDTALELHEIQANEVPTAGLEISLWGFNGWDQAEGFEAFMLLFPAEEEITATARSARVRQFYKAVGTLKSVQQVDRKGVQQVDREDFYRLHMAVSACPGTCGSGVVATIDGEARVIGFFLASEFGKHQTLAVAWRQSLITHLLPEGQVADFEFLLGAKQTAILGIELGGKEGHIAAMRKLWGSEPRSDRKRLVATFFSWCEHCIMKDSPEGSLCVQCASQAPQADQALPRQGARSTERSRSPSRSAAISQCQCPVYAEYLTTILRC